MPQAASKQGHRVSGAAASDCANMACIALVMPAGG